MGKTSRQSNIFDYLQIHGYVTSQTLADIFEVSTVTIRKDLLALERKGKIKKTFGGAVPITNTEISELNVPAPILQNDTITILAQRALQFIEPDDIIFLGSGSTCCKLASMLPSNMNISVVTNNISALPSLLNKDIKVFIVGGEVATLDGKLYFSSYSDPMTYFQSISIKKAFTSCFGCGITSGITVESVISSYIFKILPKLQNQWYLMVSSEKFTKTGMYKIGPMDMANYIITDHMPDNMRAYINTTKTIIIE